MAATVTARVQAADGAVYDLVVALPPVLPPARVRVASAPASAPQSRRVWNGTAWS